jgi:hypothetical protein
MKKFLVLFCGDLDYLFAQTKVSGVVVDKQNQPIPFCECSFQGSSEGIVTNEDGKFT